MSFLTSTPTDFFKLYKAILKKKIVMLKGAFLDLVTFR